MRLRPDGCVLCGSTWGDHWEEIEGERHFFCCEVCARQLKSLISSLLTATGWDRLDALEIEGDRRGRLARASRQGQTVTYSFVFDDLAQVRRLRPAPSGSARATGVG